MKTPAEINHEGAVAVEAGSSIGKPADMYAGRSRVDGSIEFALNAEVPGMVHAALVRSTVPHAEIRSIDVSAALALEGVVSVMTAADFDKPGAPSRHYGPVINDQPVLCGRKVRFVGDPIVAVAAETPHIARMAADLVEVEYDELPAVTGVTEALAADAPLVHDQPPRARQRSYSDIRLLGREGNVCTKFQVRKGDVDAAIAQADHVIDDVYYSPAVSHVTMEPHVVVASWGSHGLHVISSTQAPFAVRDTLTEMFNVSASQVRVTVPPIGGGYGGKTYAKLEPVTAALAWHCGRPVKLVLSREEEFLTSTKHAAEIHMRTAVTSDGTITARDVTIYFNGGAYADISPRLIKNGSYSCVGPYRIPNVRIDSYALYTNQVPAGAYRGYGVSQAAWGYESQMDQIADAIGMDPVELRHRNLLKPGEEFATGEVMSEAVYDELLDMAAEAVDWPTDTRVELGGDMVRAKGIAVILKSTITPSTSHAAVRLDNDGSVHVLTSSVEMGQGAHTVLAQIAAQALEVDLEQVSVSTPDTAYTPYDQTTSSSRTTRAMGGAVTKAAGEVRGRLFERAASMLGVPAEKLVLNEGKVEIRDVLDSGIPIEQVMADSRTGSIVGQGEVITAGGLDPETGQGLASDHWHQGSAAVELDVDLATGKVYLRSLYAAALAGRVINPKLAKMQMHGSMIFGIGHALYEEMIFEDGQLTNPNLSDYAITTMGDMPARLEIGLLEEDGAATIHGLGETVLPPVIAAIGNAVARATGARVRRLPITPERVVQAMEEL
jgi:CO/xanthine dehydrogenase Mo-binding subunit